MRNTFTFGGILSSDYGVYISGTGVFNAPERDITTVEIPGRDGVLTLDNGRFREIAHTYPAFVVPPFKDNIRGLRNALLSKRGLVRLSDTYHSDEYYLAYYEKGLEVEPTVTLKEGELEIEFTRDPRRFLLTGETPVELGAWCDTTTVSGDVVSIANDGTQGIKALTVDIEPIQDLHGYDAPWPAGGGKNLWVPFETQTKNGVTITADGGKVTINGTATADTYFETYVTYSGTQGTPFYIAAFNPAASTTWRLSIFVLTSNGSPQANLNTANALYRGSFSADTNITRLRLRVPSGESYTNFVLYPYFQIGGEEPTEFSPYENICPISDTDTVNAYVSPTTSAQDAEVTTVNLGRTVYGGTLDIVSGALTVTDAMIASYSGQTLPSTWISDRDVYAAGRTPTTGAQVVYTLATPETYNLTPAQVDLLLGVNNVWSDAGPVSVEYGTSRSSVVNPTLFASRPVIRVYGYGTLTVGDVTVTVAQNPYEYIDIDSEMMDCYHGDDNANSYVSFSDGEFPELPAGPTALSYSGSITRVMVTPHWWRL